MNSTGIRVKIQEYEKSIYEYESPECKENDLNTLLDELRFVRSYVNDFFTTLIEERCASSNAQNKTSQSISSDSESDTFEKDEEEVKEIEEEVEKTEEEGEKNERVHRKKCKLSE